jgi:DNA-binding transcriptional ArsR family regulator
MVEYPIQLDLVFNSLSNATRRDIFKRITGSELSVSEIAENYKMSLAAVSKHLKILERAKLITRRRDGKQYMVTAKPEALKDVQKYLAQYEKLWNARFDALEELLNKKGDLDVKS